MEGKSYVLALLAKQVRSFNHLKKESVGRFKASMGFLTIWFASHMTDYGNHMVNGTIVSKNYDLIESFSKRIYIEDSSPNHYWIPILQDMLPEEIIWVAIWFKSPIAIIRCNCKGYVMVLLIVIARCTGYYPACVLRQYGPL